MWMMKRVCLTLAIACSASVALAQSEYYRVHLQNGSIVPGRLTEITKDKVVLQSTPSPKEFPVNELKFVQIPAEPKELMEARNAAVDGHNEEVIAALDKIPPPALGKEDIKQDVEFYRALANARLAMAGTGDARAAGSALVSFINANKNSYHFYEANETAGDLLVAVGMYDQAPTYYRALAAAPWPDYRVRANVALGRTLQSQGKHEEAMRQFESVLASEPKGKGVENLLLAARIGKARSLVETGKGQEGVQLLQDAIDKAPADAAMLYALAYNALGQAYFKLNQPKNSLYAYLHVDLLYNQMPEQHAEALYHLKQLWTQMNKPERAKAAEELLKTRYASSAWNK
jgi:tetratricopeptide (TPR) repeat protein